MANDKYRKIQEYFGPQYDSDEDLPEETKKKLQERFGSGAQKLREEAWEKADMYPKLKRMVKGAWYGDKRKPKN